MKVDKYLMREGRKNPVLFRKVIQEYRQAAKDTYLETPDAVSTLVKRDLQVRIVFEKYGIKYESQPKRDPNPGFWESLSVTGFMLTHFLPIGMCILKDRISAGLYGPDVIKKANSNRQNMQASLAQKLK
jgi:hypothetical protein